MDPVRLQHLSKLATAMDQQFRLPGTDIRFGWDAILGLIPGIGDTAGLAISGYIIAIGREMGIPGWMIGVMIWNVFLDWLIGLVPLIGDVFDIGWKANRRNIALMENYIQKKPLYEAAPTNGTPAT